MLVADFEDTRQRRATTRSRGTTAVTQQRLAPRRGHLRRDDRTWQLYLDGVLDRTLVLASAFQPESTSIQHAALGTVAHLDRRAPARRLLRTARSTRSGSGTSPARGAQIPADRDHELTAGTGLIARYGLNEGTRHHRRPRASPAPRPAR